MCGAESKTLPTMKVPGTLSGVKKSLWIDQACAMGQTVPIKCTSGSTQDSELGFMFLESTLSLILFRLLCQNFHKETLKFPWTYVSASHQFPQLYKLSTNVMLLSFQVFATGNYGGVEVNSVTISDILCCLRVVHVIHCVQSSYPTKVPTAVCFYNMVLRPQPASVAHSGYYTVHNVWHRMNTWWLPSVVLRTRCRVLSTMWQKWSALHFKCNRLHESIF
jgi:hypothetical protein